MIECEDYLYLVKQEVNRLSRQKSGKSYLNIHRDRDDLYSAGRFGLAKAFLGFSEWRKGKQGTEHSMFEAYARLHIRGQIKKEVARSFPMGRRAVERWKLMTKYTVSKFGEDADVFDVNWDFHASNAGISPREAKETLRGFRCGYMFSVEGSEYVRPKKKIEGVDGELEVCDLIRAAGLTEREESVLHDIVFREMRPHEAGSRLGLSQSKSWKAFKHGIIHVYCYCIEKGLYLSGMDKALPPEGYASMPGYLKKRLAEAREKVSAV